MVMGKKAPLPGLMLITDTGLFPEMHSFLDAIEKALAGGVKFIQLREKGLCGRDLLGLARRLRAITGRHSAGLIINERADIAKLVGADGLHLPVRAFSVREARGLLGEGALIGVSTHSTGEARKAARDNADYITFGPVYKTPSKSRYGEPLGLEALKEAARGLTIPIYALGGIQCRRVREVMENGASGVALISAILASKDISESAGEIKMALEAYMKNEKISIKKNLLSRKESP